jgi:hypothetical protein
MQPPTPVEQGGHFKPSGNDLFFRLGPEQWRVFDLKIEPAGDWDVVWSVSDSSPITVATIDPETGRLQAADWEVVEPPGGTNYDQTIITIKARVTGSGGYVDGILRIKLCFA